MQSILRTEWYVNVTLVLALSYFLFSILGAWTESLPIYAYLYFERHCFSYQSMLPISITYPYLTLHTIPVLMCPEGTVHSWPYSPEIAQQLQHYITTATTISDTWGCVDGTAHCCPRDDQHMAATRAAEYNILETYCNLTQWCFRASVTWVVQQSYSFNQTYWPSAKRSSQWLCS